jgi:hypothetical protein
MPINERDKPNRVVGNFRRNNEHLVEKDQLSRADALGVKPPALNEEQKAGLAAEARIVGGRTQAKIAAHAQYAKEKAEYEKARDNAIWQKIEARRMASL